MLKRVLCGLFLGVLVLTAGCSAPVEGKAADATDKPPTAERVLIPVEVAHPQRLDISAYFETTTRVQAENRVDVLSKGTGMCQKVTVDEGSLVKAGQVLAELDRSELEAAMRQTQVTVQQQKTAYEIAERSLAEGIGAAAQRDNTKFAYEQAKAALEMHQVQLGNQTIKSPINGIITRRVIQAGMLVSPGMPVFSVVDTESFVLPIQVPEKELSRLSIGQLAKVNIDSLKGQELDATVRRINPGVDPLSGTVKVLLDFAPEMRNVLREAAFARVKLVMQTNQGALVVPKDAVLEENARSYVMVVAPESVANPAEGETAPAPAEGEIGGLPVFVAQRVEVKVGLEDSNNIEVTGGIDDATQVVVMGQHTLKPNSLVNITNAGREIEARKDISLDDALAAAKKKSEEEAKKKQQEEAAKQQ